MKPCSLCAHPQRELIDKLLVNGSTLKEIEDRYGLSKSAISRHRAEHISIMSPAVAMKPEIIAGSDNLIDQLQDIHQRTLSILSNAEQSGREETALKAIGRATSNIELMAKISLVLADRLNVANDQERKHIIVNVSGYSDGEGGVVTDMDMRVRDVANFIEERRKDGKTLDLAAMTREDLESLIVAAHMSIEKESTTWRDQLRGRINRLAVRAEDLTDDQLARIVASGQDNPTTEKPTYKPESVNSPTVKDSSIYTHLSTESGQIKTDNAVEVHEATEDVTTGLNREQSLDKSAKAVDPNSEEARKQSFEREWRMRQGTPRGMAIFGGSYTGEQ